MRRCQAESNLGNGESFIEWIGWATPNIFARIYPYSSSRHGGSSLKTHVATGSKPDPPISRFTFPYRFQNASR